MQTQPFRLMKNRLVYIIRGSLGFLYHVLNAHTWFQCSFGLAAKTRQGMAQHELSTSKHN